jgi:hypothetical protein
MDIDYIPNQKYMRAIGGIILVLAITEVRYQVTAYVYSLIVDESGVDLLNYRDWVRLLGTNLPDHHRIISCAIW